MDTKLVAIAVLLIAGVAGAAIYSGFKPPQIQFAIVGEYDPDNYYPFPVQGKIYSPAWGQINCKDTGVWSTVDQISFTKQQTGWFIFSTEWAEGTYTCNSIFGCQIQNVGITCPPAGLVSNYVRNSYSVKINGQDATYPYPATSGQKYTIRAFCVYNFGGIPTYNVVPDKIDVSIQGKVAQLYLESHGYTPSGWLGGSEGCKLISTDATTLKNMQPTSTIPGSQGIPALGPLQGVQSISPTETKNVIVGWREDPVFGNINTQGQYNGQDVLCQNFNSISSLTKVATYGGNTYYVKNSNLVTYAGTNSMCCDNTGCSGNFKCEKYQCVANPVTCQYGQAAWSIDQCGNSFGEGCIESGGTFKIRTWTKDSNNCCIPQDRTQLCCPATCDRISTPTQKYSCNPSQGCVQITTQQQCGTGMCCNVQGEGAVSWQKMGYNIANSPYLTQSCINKQCCFDNSMDPYRGTCKDSCAGVPPAVCGNNVCELGETQSSCPQDCGTPVPPTDWTQYLPYIALALVAALFVAAMIKKRKGGKRYGKR